MIISRNKIFATLISAQLFSACGKENSQGRTLEPGSDVESRDSTSRRTLSMKGLNYTSQTQPEWQWHSGQDDNSDTLYRYSLDNDNLALDGTATRARSFRPNEKLTTGLHILYLQERLLASPIVWSPVVKFETTISDNIPSSPEFIGGDHAAPGSPLTWSWKSQNDIEIYLIKIGDADFSQGATIVRGTSYTLPAMTTAKDYTLYLMGRSLAGKTTPMVSKTMIVE